ncbi:MAG: hypothetical protein RSD74_02010 [Angelakisella sp.]
MPIITTNYLNPTNPDVKQAYRDYQRAHHFDPWAPMSPEHLQAFELGFLAALPSYQEKRENLYPFFLNINGCLELNEAFRKHFTGNRPLTDAGRDEFERQFAARKVRSYGKPT